MAIDLTNQIIIDISQQARNDTEAKDICPINFWKNLTRKIWQIYTEFFIL